MQPQVVYDEFYTFETNEGSMAVPSDVFNFYDDVEKWEVEKQIGWFARLSMPGYLDATDWIGPFDSEKDALEELNNTYYEE